VGPRGVSRPHPEVAEPPQGEEKGKKEGNNKGEVFFNVAPRRSLHEKKGKRGSSFVSPFCPQLAEPSGKGGGGKWRHSYIRGHSHEKEGGN